MAVSFGLLNVNKPAGVTSRRVVDQVVPLVRPAKAGHAGTLDPLATGVLVICVGKATRLIDVVQQQAKTYQAAFLLGLESDSDDVTGNVSPKVAASEITREQIEAALGPFRGRIQQVPPKFSAVHVEGRRAYDLARKGEDMELAPREVEVYRLELTRFAYPEMELVIECGSGTYVRSLGRDLGAVLGCGAVLSSLVRTRIGPYGIEDAVEPERLTRENVGEFLLPPTTAVAGLPTYHATVDETAAIRAGRPFGSAGVGGEVVEAGVGTSIAVLDANDGLLCLAEWDAQKARLLPRRVFVD